ncbi:uncharacterized protein LOC135210056 [Macrobrachium nipponense]|uniref:uncharacterized protein LOC135210056 n=1 Tax=Macrobrachium nipponense TaxID=159736 RepID=UPI0030C7E0B5
MMSRIVLNLAVVFVCLLALSMQVHGSCSQYGHSCFGAHGKRNGDQYPALEAGPLYPAANQLSPLEVKAQEEALSLDEPAVSSPEIIANVRNWLSILGRRLRQRTSQSSGTSSAQNYAGYLQ